MEQVEFLTAALFFDYFQRKELTCNKNTKKNCDKTRKQLLRYKFKF